MLAGVATTNELKKGTGNDAQVEPNIPVFDIPKVKINSVLHELKPSCLPTQAMNLSPASKARFDVLAEGIVCNQLGIFVVGSNGVWTGPFSAEGLTPKRSLPVRERSSAFMLIGPRLLRAARAVVECGTRRLRPVAAARVVAIPARRIVERDLAPEQSPAARYQRARGGARGRVRVVRSAHVDPVAQHAAEAGVGATVREQPRARLGGGPARPRRRCQPVAQRDAQPVRDLAGRHHGEAGAGPGAAAHASRVRWIASATRAHTQSGWKACTSFCN